MSEVVRPAIGKWPSIAIIGTCQVAALALWFSATATLPALLVEHDLSAFQQSLFTSAVQIGFVLGSLASAFTGLSDRIDPRRLFSLCAIVGALANALIVLLEPESQLVVMLRFLTGIVMAGVYPVGMKMAGSWASRDMGLLIGLLVGIASLFPVVRM
jgi:MFS family permease